MQALAAAYTEGGGAAQFGSFQQLCADSIPGAAAGGSTAAGHWRAADGYAVHAGLAERYRL